LAKVVYGLDAGAGAGTLPESKKKGWKKPRPKPLMDQKGKRDKTQELAFFLPSFSLSLSLSLPSFLSLFPPSFLSFLPSFLLAL
jgi:hypothetical protein